MKVRISFVGAAVDLHRKVDCQSHRHHSEGDQSYQKSCTAPQRREIDAGSVAYAESGGVVAQSPGENPIFCRRRRSSGATRVAQTLFPNEDS